MQLDEHLYKPVELALFIFRCITRDIRQMLCARKRKTRSENENRNTHSGNLQVLPPSLQPSAIRRRTQLPPCRLCLRLCPPVRGRARRCALDASTAVGCHVVSKSLRHKGRMAEQHREVVAITQVFKGLCGVLDCKLGDGGL